MWTPSRQPNPRGRRPRAEGAPAAGRGLWWSRPATVPPRLDQGLSAGAVGLPPRGIRATKNPTGANLRGLARWRTGARTGFPNRPDAVGAWLGAFPSGRIRDPSRTSSAAAFGGDLASARRSTGRRWTLGCQCADCVTASQFLRARTLEAVMPPSPGASARRSRRSAGHDELTRYHHGRYSVHVNATGRPGRIPAVRLQRASIDLGHPLEPWGWRCGPGGRPPDVSGTTGPVRCHRAGSGSGQPAFGGRGAWRRPRLPPCPPHHAHWRGDG